MGKLFCKIPKNEMVKIAFSGGNDSLVLAHFCRRNPNVILCHFHHGDEYSDDIAQGCIDRAKQLGLPIQIGYIDRDRLPNENIESYWRQERYKFLFNLPGKIVLTAHHLNDAMETWLWSSLNGKPRLINPIQHRDNGQTLLRPFIMFSRKELEDYARNHGLVPVDDPTNQDTTHTRSFIRAHIMNDLLTINPGFDTVIKKKYLTMMENTHAC